MLSARVWFLKGATFSKSPHDEAKYNNNQIIYVSIYLQSLTITHHWYI